MKHEYIRFILLSTVFFFFLISCSEDEMPTIDTTVAYEEVDVSFGPDPLQTYDVYLPANRTESSTHVVLLIHGGAWISGDKADVKGIVDLLQDFMPDYAIINMNYRLTTKPNNPLSDQLEDVDLVMKDLDMRSSDYKISDSYALVGISAGGHMALQHSYTKNNQGKIKAAGNIVGLTYFLDPAYTMATDPALRILAAQIQATTGMPYTATSFYEDISPFNAVTAESVPTIQFHGTVDPLVPNSQGPLLKAKLDEFNVPNELIIYEGEGHGWANPDNWTDTAVKFKSFVERYIDQ